MKNKLLDHIDIAIDKFNVKVIFSFPGCFSAPLFGPIQCKSYFFLFYKQFPGYFVSFLLLLACVLGKYKSRTHTGLKLYWGWGEGSVASNV